MLEVDIYSSFFIWFNRLRSDNFKFFWNSIITHIPKITIRHVANVYNDYERAVLKRPAQIDDPKFITLFF